MQTDYGYVVWCYRLGVSAREYFYHRFENVVEALKFSEVIEGIGFETECLISRFDRTIKLW